MLETVVVVFDPELLDDEVPMLRAVTETFCSVAAGALSVEVDVGSVLTT